MGGGPPKDHIVFALPTPEPTKLLDHLRSKFPSIEITYVQTSYPKSFNPTGNDAPSGVPAHIWKTATILVTFSNFPDPKDAPKLELVHLVSAGSNQMQKQPLYTGTDVTITTSSGVHGPQIAEWVVMTGLVSSHKYQQLYELQKKKQWGGGVHGGDEKAEYRSVRDLVGRRIGILGYGSIGRQVGRVAKAMGMDVVAFTATSKDTDEKKRDHGFIVPGTGDPDGNIPSEWYSGLDQASLQHFLKQDLDWLLVSVPLTEQTKHFLSTDEFKVLSQDGKRPAFITNIARGAIIDQPALIDALKSGTLAGAALDVADPEPLPNDNELWDLKNVILTPHISGLGSNYTERSFSILELNLEKREKGEKLINVVNRNRGY